MAAAKVTSAVRLVATPFTALGGAIRVVASRSVAVADGELGNQIASHKAAGTDLAASTTKNFIELQLRLFPYRFERLADEINTLTADNCCYACQWWAKATPKDFFVFFRFLVRCLASFMLGVMVCRQSVLPLIEPTSPLLPGIYEFHNPNRH